MGGVVLTAAHCLRLTGGVNVSPATVTFTPLYHTGYTPHGVWTAQQLIIPQVFQNTYRGGAISKTDAVNDYAFIVLKKNELTQEDFTYYGPVTDVTGGGAPVIVNYQVPTDAKTTIYGYTTVGSATGEDLFQDQNLTLFKDNRSPLLAASGGLSLMVSPGSPSGPTGAAGGPWFVNIANVPTLIGLLVTVAVSTSTQKNRGYSPPLDGIWNSFFVQAQEVVSHP